MEAKERSIFVEIIIGVLKRIGLGLMILIKFALFIPIIYFMVRFSYEVDRSGLFQGDLAPRTVVELLLDGKNVNGFEQMDERQIVRLYAQDVPDDAVPDVIGLGSSRVLQVTSKVADSDHFFNLGVTGADVRDVMTSYYLMVKEKKIPKTIIWSVDPWVLHGSDEAFDKRADAELYNEFLQKVLGIDTGYVEPDQTELWKALADPAYFQGNWEYYNRKKNSGIYTDEDGEELPFSCVDDDEIDYQYETIKLKDGSIRYDRDFRSRSQDEILAGAIAQSETFASIHMEGFDKIDPGQCKAFETFIKYANTQGTQVVLVLSPFHPFLYDAILGKADEYSGFFQVEDWIRTYAKRTKTPLYGSYDPLILEGIEEMDFYDGVHCTSEALSKFFPGVEQALHETASGKLPAALQQKNRTTAEERIPW